MATTKHSVEFVTSPERMIRAYRKIVHIVMQNTRGAKLRKQLDDWFLSDVLNQRTVDNMKKVLATAKRGKRGK